MMTFSAFAPVALMLCLTGGAGISRAEGLELEIGTGTMKTGEALYNDTRSLQLGLFRHNPSGLVYGIGLRRSDHNDFEFRQQTLTGLIGARHTVRGSWFVQSLLGLGISDNDNGADHSREPLAAAYLRAGNRGAGLTVALEAGLVHTDIQLALPIGSTTLLNPSGINNTVFNPFAGLAINAPRVRNLTTTALNIGWNF